MTREHLDAVVIDHQKQIGTIISALADAVRFPVTSLHYLQRARAEIDNAIARAQELDNL